LQILSDNGYPLVSRTKKAVCASSNYEKNRKSYMVLFIKALRVGNVFATP